MLAVILIVSPGDFQNQSSLINPLTTSIIIMACVTVIFAAKVTFGLQIKQFTIFKKNQLGRRSGTIFLIGYIVYTLLCYYYVILDYRIYSF